ncbi:MAG: radical SAM protein, partial [Halanaerobiales bacterium]
KDMKNIELNSPEKIIDESIEAQEELLNGFWGAKDKINVDKLEEAYEPKHAAISLSGEPMLYERMPELVKEFHDRDMTTFIVTNGTLPEKIKKSRDNNALPTQLYVSLTAPDMETYQSLNVPFDKEYWNKLKHTLKILNNLDTRTVIRLTLVEHENMHSLEKYAELIKKANPMFIEPKSYMYVGYSRKRLEEKNMPSNIKIKEFTKELLKYLPNYHIEDKQEQSHVILLMRDDLNEEDRFINL